MKTRIKTSDLAKAVNTCSNIMNNSIAIPIVAECIKIQVKDDTMTITSSDLENTMIYKLETQGMIDGEFCVEVKLLKSLLPLIQDEYITLELINSLHIYTNAGKYNINTCDATEYPIFQVPQSEGVIIPIATLRNAINKTSYAVSTDEMRPAMCGIYAEIEPNKISFTATNAQVLSNYSEELMSGEKMDFIIPRKTLATLKTLENDVTVSDSNNNIVFDADNIIIITRKIDGKYPNYKTVIPEDFEIKATVEKAILVDAVKRMSLFANKNNSFVKLQIGFDTLSISAEDIDFGKDGNEKMKCSSNGEITIGFNTKFLIDLLNVAVGNEVIINLTTPNKCAVVKSNENHFSLIMPVTIAE